MVEVMHGRGPLHRMLNRPRQRVVGHLFPAALSGRRMCSAFEHLDLGAVFD
jgi:hypothetical protein